MKMISGARSSKDSHNDDIAQRHTGRRTQQLNRKESQRKTQRTAKHSESLFQLCETLRLNMPLILPPSSVQKTKVLHSFQQRRFP